MFVNLIPVRSSHIRQCFCIITGLRCQYPVHNRFCVHMFAIVSRESEINKIELMRSMLSKMRNCNVTTETINQASTSRISDIYKAELQQDRRINQENIF